MRTIDLNNFQVATSETARAVNRRIVLNLIRKHQPISRAGLSRQSGLQRSTVSAITEELIAERWVTEGVAGRLPRGRRPTLLHLNSNRAGIIGVNVRPSTTTIGLAGLDTRFLSRESMDTGEDPEQFVQRLIHRIGHLRKAHPDVACEGIGIALPGRVDLSSHRLVFAPNLGWQSLALKEPLEQATGLPVELENAANACALAELWGGRHGDGVRNLVAVTISEGIGVGLVLNGQLVAGTNGMAGEFGHVTVQADGPRCRCGNRGCWEMCASDSAAIGFYNSNRAAKDSTALSFDNLLRLAGQGDRKAEEALHRMAHFLGEGLALLTTGLAPDVIVLIGEVTRAWDRLGPVVQGVIKQRLPTPAPTRIVPTDPEMLPRLRGSIILVLQKHFSAPPVA